MLIVNMGFLHYTERIAIMVPLIKDTVSYHEFHQHRVAMRHFFLLCITTLDMQSTTTD